MGKISFDFYHNEILEKRLDGEEDDMWKKCGKKFAILMFSLLIVVLLISEEM